jgi:hypothetical protein
MSNYPHTFECNDGIGYYLQCERCGRVVLGGEDIGDDCNPPASLAPKPEPSFAEAFDQALNESAFDRLERLYRRPK